MNEIKSGNIYNKLNTNPTTDTNCNYDIIYKEITRARTIHMPNKLVKFNIYKHKKSTWITHGLLTSIRYRDKMYKQLKLTNPSSNNYETIKIHFSLFKNDTRNTWKTIKEFLSKTILKMFLSSF